MPFDPESLSIHDLYRQPVPPHIISRPLNDAALALWVERVGVFHVAPSVNGHRTAVSAYSEPTTAPGYPEQRIYYLETNVIHAEQYNEFYSDNPGEREMREQWENTTFRNVKDFAGVGSLLTAMREVAPPEQWQVFKGNARSVQ
jgi:hypothetical protein